MTRYIHITLYLVLLSACGQGLKLKPDQFVDPEFVEQVVKFNSLTQTETVSSIRFSYDMPMTTAGTCNYYRPNDGRNSIDINLSIWKQLSKAGKEQLMFHELGHCTLGRMHKDDMGMLGGFMAPKSIMNSHLFLDRLYVSNRDHYLQELVGNR